MPASGEKLAFQHRPQFGWRDFVLQQQFSLLQAGDFELIDGPVQSERFDLFAKLEHRDFPGGRALRTPMLVAAMAWYKLRDALW